MYCRNWVHQLLYFFSQVLQMFVVLILGLESYHLYHHKASPHLFFTLTSAVKISSPAPTWGKRHLKASRRLVHPSLPGRGTILGCAHKRSWAPANTVSGPWIAQVKDIHSTCSGSRNYPSFFNWIGQLQPSRLLIRAAQQTCLWCLFASSWIMKRLTKSSRSI